MYERTDGGPVDIDRLTRYSDHEWHIEPEGRMHVPGILYASAALIEAMDDKVREQVANVAALPGIVQASYAMPDAHWGYGFPIGGVAAFDPEQGGVVSAGGVGFDISCGVRSMHTGLQVADVEPLQERLADVLYGSVPAGLGSTGGIRLSTSEMDAMLAGGACWAVERGWGRQADLSRIEEQGCMAGAEPDRVSDKAKRRQRDEMGTLGSGNHYLEVQKVAAVFDAEAARAFELQEGDVLVTVHCGSRGLGHQIGTEFLKEMAAAASSHAIELPDRELACAPIQSALGQRYLGAMRAGINCALANRQIITHLTRIGFNEVFPQADLRLLYDVSHNTCKEETHEVDGHQRRLFVHRKGATRAWGPGHPDLPEPLRQAGQPVIIGGTMGTTSYILAGNEAGARLAYHSACHGAGRAMSRRQATRQWRGQDIRRELARDGITLRSASNRGVAEEAPHAYKDAGEVVEATERAGLARRVAQLKPMACVKG